MFVKIYVLGLLLTKYSGLQIDIEMFSQHISVQMFPNKLGFVCSYGLLNYCIGHMLIMRNILVMLGGLLGNVSVIWRYGHY